jgi:hypothetical protein
LAVSAAAARSRLSGSLPARSPASLPEHRGQLLKLERKSSSDVTVKGEGVQTSTLQER